LSQYLRDSGPIKSETVNGYFMAALGILKIPWEKWVRWPLPLLLIWLALGMAAVVIALALHLGPF